jgi:hypothetical protein
MEWQEIQDELREVSNNLLDLSKQIRTHSTDMDQLSLICVRLRAEQARLALLIDMKGDG